MKKIALILTLPLAVSLVAVAAQKKDASKGSTQSATNEEHVVLAPGDLKWMDAPPGVPPGAKIAVLDGDPNTGDKFDEAAGKELGAGGYLVMPAGMKHYAWTPAEAIIQIQGMGPFVDQVRESGRRSAQGEAVAR